jgi:hypothetical protein
MRFFTPELFVRFNSSADAEADHANQEWEASIQAYRYHLAGILDRMPPQVKKLSELCLHDAELLAREPLDQPIPPFPFQPRFEILSLKRGDEIVSLIYLLWESVQACQPPKSWPFSRARTHWLFDEVDVDPSSPGEFFHRILFSDGSVVQIPFVAVWIHRVHLGAENRQGVSKKRA